MMVHIFVHKIVLKVIGKNIKNYMYKLVCNFFHYLNFENYFHITETTSSTNESGENYNPWPGYHFTGKLRPYPQVKKILLKKKSIRKMIYF
jgi:hypothetical protein